MQSREAIEAGAAVLSNVDRKRRAGHSLNAAEVHFAQAKFLESIAVSLATLTELAQKPVYEIQVESELGQGVTRAEMAEAFRKLDALPRRC